MRRVLMTVALLAGLLFPGAALAQEKSTSDTGDIHLNFGWRAWFVTVRTSSPLNSSGGGGTETGDGIMSGPTVSLELDRKWSLGVAYLTTDLGDRVDPNRNKLARRLEKDTSRSDFDMSLRYRLLDWLGIYLSFKRLDFELTSRTTPDVNRGSIQGIGFGLAASHHLWAPAERSSLFLSGSAGYFPLAWTDIVTRDGDDTFSAKNNWFTAEAGVGYARPVGPLLGSLIAGYRYQTFGLETGRGTSARHFADFDFEFYGPTLTLSFRW